MVHIYTTTSSGILEEVEMKKKYPRLPNGYGQIRKLSGKRRNPFGVYPPQTEEDENGRRLPVKALCYVPTWTAAFAVLTAYKAGTYTPGMEADIITAERESGLKSPSSALDAILADYARIRRATLGLPESLTFAEVYDLYFRDKFESGKQYSAALVNSTRAAYKNLTPLHDFSFRGLKTDDLQAVVDACPLKHGSLEMMVLVIKQMYRYALAHDLCDRDYGAHVSVRIPDDDEHGVPFTEEELVTLWNNSDDPTVEMILIMCYAGYRIAAYKTLEVNLEERYFRGGNKTASGKDVVTPIHSAIYPLVARRIARDGAILTMLPNAFRVHMYAALERIDIQKHTPHDCKHTFSALCERYGVNERDRKRMLGHRVGDITNDVYGHRTLEDLRAEIEKIKLSKACQKRE